MGSRSNRRFIRIVVLLGILALLAAACDDDDSDAEDASEDPAAELTGEPVRLMAIFDGSGSADTSGIVEGAVAAADAINRDGGIAGGPVEIIECDTGDDPNTAAECGRRAVSEGFVAVVGSLSLHAGEYLPLLAEAEVPSLGQAPTAAVTFTSAASFPIQGAAVSSIGGLAGALAEEGATNIALVRPDLAQGAALAGLANLGLERFEIEIGNDVAVPEGAPDMAPFVEAALGGGSDAVLVALAGEEAANFLTELRASDPEIPVALVATLGDEVLESLGDTTEGMILQTQFLSASFSDAPGPQEFADDMEAAGFGDVSGSRGPNSWASVMILAEALEGATENTAAVLWDALSSGQEFATGITPPVQFAEPAGALPRIFNTCLIITTIEDGVRVPVTGEFEDPATGEPCRQP